MRKNLSCSVLSSSAVVRLAATAAAALCKYSPLVHTPPPLVPGREAADRTARVVLADPTRIGRTYLVARHACVLAQEYAVLSRAAHRARRSTVVVELGLVQLCVFYDHIVVQLDRRPLISQFGRVPWRSIVPVAPERPGNVLIEFLLFEGTAFVGVGLVLGSAVMGTVFLFMELTSCIHDEVLLLYYLCVRDGYFQLIN